MRGVGPGSQALRAQVYLLNLHAHVSTPYGVHTALVVACVNCPLGLCHEPRLPGASCQLELFTHEFETGCT